MRNWAPKDGSLTAEMKSEDKRFTSTLKAKGKGAKAFGEYLSENLAQLYEAFGAGSRPQTGLKI